MLVEVHPMSMYYHLGNSPDYIIFHELVLTEERYIRDICAIDPRWLAELAPEYYACKETQVSGTSGDVGVPKPKKKATKETSDSTNSRILFKKPTKKATSKLPVHIGKRKGGLRSQF